MEPFSSFSEMHISTDRNRVLESLKNMYKTYNAIIDLETKQKYHASRVRKSEENTENIIRNVAIKKGGIIKALLCVLTIIMAFILYAYRKSSDGLFAYASLGFFYYLSLIIFFILMIINIVDVFKNLSDINRYLKVKKVKTTGYIILTVITFVAIEEPFARIIAVIILGIVDLICYKLFVPRFNELSEELYEAAYKDVIKDVRFTTFLMMLASSFYCFYIVFFLFEAGYSKRHMFYDIVGVAFGAALITGVLIFVSMILSKLVYSLVAGKYDKYAMSGVTSEMDARRNNAAIAESLSRPIELAFEMYKHWVPSQFPSDFENPDVIEYFYKEISSGYANTLGDAIRNLRAEQRYQEIINNQKREQVLQGIGIMMQGAAMYQNQVNADRAINEMQYQGDRIAREQQLTREAMYRR